MDHTGMDMMEPSCFLFQQTQLSSFSHVDDLNRFPSRYSSCLLWPVFAP